MNMEQTSQEDQNEVEVFDEDMKLTGEGKEKLVQEMMTKAEREGLSLEEMLAHGNERVEQLHSEKRKKQEDMRIAKLQEELKQEKQTKQQEQKERSMTTTEVQAVESALSKAQKIIEKYNINPEMTIAGEGDQYGEGYEYSDKKVEKKGGWFTSNTIAPQLAVIGRIAESLGVDLTEGKKFKDVMEMIQERIGSNDSSAEDLREAEEIKAANTPDPYWSDFHALLEQKDSFFKRFGRSDASFLRTNEYVTTKGGVRAEIVTRKGQKYLKVPQYLGGGGDPGHQRTVYHYVPQEKVANLLS